jgi:hypothetical protein
MNVVGKLAPLYLTFALAMAISPTAMAQVEDDPSALAMAGDLVVARPLGLAITAVGAAVFVVSLPFSILGGSVEQAAETLVQGPARQTFMRCLGCRAAVPPASRAN